MRQMDRVPIKPAVTVPRAVAIIAETPACRLRGHMCCTSASHPDQKGTFFRQRDLLGSRKYTAACRREHFMRRDDIAPSIMEHVRAFHLGRGGQLFLATKLEVERKTRHAARRKVNGQSNTVRWCRETGTEDKKFHWRQPASWKL